MIGATMEVSRVTIIRHSLDNAAYEGARVGVVPGATSDEVIAAAEAYLSNLQLAGWVVAVAPTPLTDTASEVSVVVSLPLADNSWGSRIFSPNTYLNGRSTLTTERYLGLAQGE